MRNRPFPALQSSLTMPWRTAARHGHVDSRYVNHANVRDSTDLGSRDPEAAQPFRMRKNAACCAPVASRFGAVMTTVTTGNILLSAAIDDFLEYCLIEAGLASLTLRTYRQVLGALASWLGGDATVGDLDKATIRRWQHVLIAERQLDQAT